jgi:hypothetical protein
MLSRFAARLVCTMPRHPRLHKRESPIRSLQSFERDRLFADLRRMDTDTLFKSNEGFGPFWFLSP